MCFVQKLPEARSGHTLVAIGDKLYMCGGWNAMRQFDDLWAFDTHNRLWNKIEGASGDKWGTSLIKLEHKAKGA
jgi:N-acetylneuraminic acid mutarotase